MVTKLADSITARTGSNTWSRDGFAVRATERAGGVDVLCARIGNDGTLSTFTLKARRVVCAMPLFVAARVFPQLAAYGFDPARDLPPRAPWLVSNFLLDGMPAEEAGVPLAWDNVVYDGAGRLCRVDAPDYSHVAADALGVLLVPGVEHASARRHAPLARAGPTRRVARTGGDRPAGRLRARTGNMRRRSRSPCVVTRWRRPTSAS